MNNINTSFESFVNEGIIPTGLKRWASKKFRPGEVGELVKNIFYDIKNNFDISSLKFERIANDRCFEPTYIYTNGRGDIIKVTYYSLEINEDNVTDLVNIEIIRDIYRFFYNKYVKRDHLQFEENKRKRGEEIRKKYLPKYTSADFQE